MDALGYALRFHESAAGWAGWMQPGVPRPLFLIGRPHDGAPGLRPHYHPDYYRAYVHDPGGNKIGLCRH